MSHRPSSPPPQLKSQGRKANTEWGYCVTAQFARAAFSYSLTSTHINQTIKERQTPLFPPPHQETNEANDRFRTTKITQEMHPTTENSSMALYSVMDPGYCHGATKTPNTHSWSQSFIWKFPYCNVARSSAASNAQKKIHTTKHQLVVISSTRPKKAFLPMQGLKSRLKGDWQCTDLDIRQILASAALGI